MTGEAFARAGDLELYRSLRDDAALAWRNRFAASPPPIATALLVGFQIRVWWMAQLPGASSTLTAVGTKWSPFVFEDAEVWRLLTMGLIHTEWLHLSANLLWLGYVGWSIERAFGWKNLVVLYFGSVLGGSLLSVFWATYTPSLGSSGGVFGLIAAVVVFGFVRPGVLPTEARRWFGPAMLPYLVIIFWMGWSSPTTDNWAHLGGMVSGLILGLVLDPDEVERRRSWARRVRWATAAVGLATLLVLAAAGPRLEPLVDSEHARRASLPRESRRPPRETPGGPRFEWQVPGGWRTAVGDARFPGFAGPKDNGRARFVGVRLADRDRAVSAEEAGSDWVNQLRRDWPDAEVSDPRPARLAGHDAVTITATYGHRGSERVATWRGAARGVWLLEAVWQVDRANRSRLEPLADRVDASIVWPDPPELTSARTEVAATPRSVRSRERLAAALARVGDVDGAIALREALIAERPDDADAWKAYLKDLATLGPLARDRDLPGILDRALEAVPAPAVTVAVADVLDAVGRPEEAKGLLVVAWDRAPGEGNLKRAMTRRDLATALDPRTARPWGLVHGPVGGPRSPAEIEARQTWPLTLAGASRAADALAADRRVATEEAVLRIEAMDGVRLEPLLVLKEGWIVEDLAQARTVMAEELARAVAGTPPDWMPDEVVGALAEHPAYAEAVGGAD